MIPLLVAAGYLLLLLALGLASSRFFRGTSRDFFVASHSIGPFVLLMSLFGTTMTSFALVGSTGKAFERGIGVFGLMASISALVHVAVFYFLGLRLWGIGRRHGYVTQIQYFRARFGSPALGYALFPCLVLLMVPYLLIGIKGAGSTLLPLTAGAFPDLFPPPENRPEWAGGIPPWLTGLAVCLVVMTYVFLGGSRGAAWANTFQTLVFIATGLVAFAFIAQALGGMRQAAEITPQLRRGTGELKLEKSHRYDPGRQELAILEDSSREEGRPGVASPSASSDPDDSVPSDPPGSGSAASPGDDSLEEDPLLQEMLEVVEDDRQNTGQNIQEFRLQDSRFGQWADRLDGHRPYLARTSIRPGQTIPGMDSVIVPWSRVSIRGDSGFVGELGFGKWLFFTYLFVPLSAGMFPHLFQNWLTARRASAFRLTFVAYPICMLLVWLPCVLIGTWATGVLDSSIPSSMVLGEMLRLLLDSPLLTGLLAAGILAAIMSSLDSQFLSLSSIFTNDVVLHAAKGREIFSERETIWIARVFVVMVVVVAWALSLVVTSGVFDLAVWCFTGFSALVPPLVASLYWRRTTLAGVYASLAAGMGCWLFLLALSTLSTLSSLSARSRVPGPWDFSLDPVVHPSAWCFLASSLALAGVSLATRPPEEAILKKFFPGARRGAEGEAP